jgi:hypothetical protein
MDRRCGLWMLAASDSWTLITYLITLLQLPDVKKAIHKPSKLLSQQARQARPPNL